VRQARMQDSVAAAAAATTRKRPKIAGAAAVAAAAAAADGGGSRAGTGAFGEPCATWSDCASGLCAASCDCNDALLAAPQPCKCEVLHRKAVTATCGGFFLSDNPCAMACPPCTKELTFGLPLGLRLR